MLIRGVVSSPVRGVVGSGEDWEWSPGLLGASLAQWLRPKSSTVELNGSAIAGVLAPTTEVDAYGQGLTASQPAWTDDRIVTDGTADFLESGAPYSFNTYAQLPDSTYAPSVGKGFTNTGLTRAPNGSWWVANFGKAASSDPTFDGSVVNVSSDFLTKVAEWPASGWADWSGGLQGIAYDTTADRLVVPCRDTQTVFVINPATGAKVSSVAISFTPNGCAYDPDLDQYIIGSASSGDVSWINKATGAATKTIRLRTGPADQLFFDPDYGIAGALYASFGANGIPGHVIKFDVATGTPLRQWLLSEGDAIEGIFVDGDTLWACNDGGYHSSSAQVPSNVINSFTIDTATPGYGSRLVLAFVLKAAATSQAATKTVLAGGDPTSTGYSGVGVYLTATINQVRLTIRNGASSNSINWTVSALTTEAVYYLDINTTAQTAGLYQNGTLISSQSIANISGDLPNYVWTVGASYEGAGATRFIAETVGQFVAATTGDYRTEIEGWLSS